MLDLRCLDEALQYEGGLSRRLFLAYGTALSAIPLLGVSSRAKGSTAFESDPFTLGVASGDPDSTSVVLWTRLAPEPLDPNGGLDPHPIDVHWEVAEDETFTKPIASGTALATPQLAHSVHVVVTGLRPDRWYWYRFHRSDGLPTSSSLTRGSTGPISRTATANRRSTTPR
jgi:alkaline phosphatase D